MNATKPGGETPQFEDRAAAGHKLAALLTGYTPFDPLVLALPRGGVPVAYPVAEALGATLDVFAVRKLGAPQQPELAVGAVAPGGVVLLDHAAIEALGISDETIQAITARESAALERQLLRFRGSGLLTRVEGRTVILIDDGFATGLTAAAAVAALRTMSPERIVLAAPVAAARTVEWLKTKADEVVVAFIPAEFAAVGLWYGNFDQTSDAEVLDLLERYRSWNSA